MQVVILAGGFGTRLSELTGLIPKPMVPIGGKPILYHIMSSYASHGFSDFVIAMGYKAEVIRDYFSNFRHLNSDFTISLNSGEVRILNSQAPNWKVSLIDTGIDSLTGRRLKSLEPFLDDGPFMLTYGDGLSDVNLSELLSFHRGHGRLVTLTAVRPVAKFGELSLTNDTVNEFQEKPQLQSGWVNGGFMVIEKEFVESMTSENVMLEREPLSGAASAGELMAFKHEGFWQCMDTKREVDYLEGLWNIGDAPWAK